MMLYIVADAKLELNIVELDPKEEKVRPTLDAGKLPFNTTFLTLLIRSVYIETYEVLEIETTESTGVSVPIWPGDSILNRELIPVLYPLPPLLIVNVSAVEFSILDTLA